MRLILLLLCAALISQHLASDSLALQRRAVRLRLHGRLALALLGLLIFFGGEEEEGVLCRSCAFGEENGLATVDLDGVGELQGVPILMSR